jgi:hypothetical protein
LESGKQHRDGINKETIMAISKPKLGATSGGEQVTVSAWSACYNSESDIIVLSCTVSTSDSSATISGVGLILNDKDGKTLASFYAELSGGCESVEPALNLPPGELKDGDGVGGVVYGEAQGQHYFIETELTISDC